MIVPPVPTPATNASTCPSVSFQISGPVVFLCASGFAEIGKLESLGKSAIIITSPIVRMYFKKMTEDYFKDLIVLSYNEVESNVELQSVGMVTA